MALLRKIRCPEKASYEDLELEAPRGRRGQLSIIVCQHILLWASYFVVGGTVYITSIGAVQPTTVPVVIVLIAAGTTSTFYLAFANAVAYLSSDSITATSGRRSLFYHSAAQLLIRLSVVLWLIGCGITITFTVARHASCSSKIHGPANIDTGMPCVLQRSGVGASLLALLTSATLLTLNERVQEPFRCHLFGITKQPHALPQTIVNNNPPLRAMYSEMSFKCKSSASLSSRTPATSRDASMSTLYTKEKAVGLGIYTSEPLFLTPRPSLSSIRTHTIIQSLPKHSPIPPLPAYFPERYRRGTAAHKTVCPPRRPPRPERTPRGRTIRAGPSTPALSTANLNAYNRSMESLSSVYSRSVSGEQHSRQRGAENTRRLTVGSRSCISGTTTTLNRSPLAVVSLASHPERCHIQTKRSQSSRSSTDSDIDDTWTLQARLPVVSTVSECRDPKYWTDCQAVTSPKAQATRPRSGLHRLAMRRSKGREARHPYKQCGERVQKTYRLLEPWQY